jgi:hypothetical protein
LANVAKITSSIYFCIHQIHLQTPPNGALWLEEMIRLHRMTQNHRLNLPKRDDGLEYQLQDLTKEQQNIACIILSKLKQWIDLSTNIGDNEQFQPLRMTVSGGGGTGKSTLINTLVTTIRQISQDNNSVHVLAPTGAAAFNVGGQTIHRMLSVNVRDPDKMISQQACDNLGQRLQTTLALFFDERSMISQKVLGAAEINVSRTAHGFGHDAEDWGGVPIVVLFGDDCQIPPTMAAGAFECLTSHYQRKLGATSNGRQQFLNCSQVVLELKQIKRVTEGQELFMDILQHCRHGRMTDAHCDTLMKLHLNNFPPQTMTDIKKRATFIFANREPMIQHNTERLREEHSNTNPVAHIKAIIMDRKGVTKKYSKHLVQEQAPKITNI